MQAIELQPQLADAYAQRGLVRLLQGRADTAAQQQLARRGHLQ